jgi:hypothetical protein
MALDEFLHWKLSPVDNVEVRMQSARCPAPGGKGPPELYPDGDRRYARHTHQNPY